MGYSLNTQTAVAVIGAGSMGAGIAQLAAQSGHAVRLHDAQAGAAAAALVRIGADLDGAVKRGKLDAAERDAVFGRIAVADSIAALAGCGLVVEAIVEKLEIKRQVFAQLEAALGPGRGARDQHLVDLDHRGRAGPAAAAAADRLALLQPRHAHEARRGRSPASRPTRNSCPRCTRSSKAWGKTSVDAPNAPGFIVNRVARPYYAEGLRLLAERIAPAPAIDRLMREAGGFALGPFELMDLIGLDVNLSVSESVFQATAYDPRYAPHLIQQELVRSGRFGRKSGRGFYAYGKDVAAPVVATVAPADGNGSLDVAAEAGLLAPLVERLIGAGVHIVRRNDLPAETLAIGDTRIALTDGRTAATVPRATR